MHQGLTASITRSFIVATPRSRSADRDRHTWGRHARCTGCGCSPSRGHPRPPSAVAGRTPVVQSESCRHRHTTNITDGAVGLPTSHESFKHPVPASRSTR
eukprot:195295-Chlamydomonas_euryale.AAC.3